MSSTPIFRESLLEARQRLARGREEIEQQHRAGSPGIQVCTRLTELLDGVTLDLYEASLADLWPEGSEEFRNQIALVAHGGYGRRDVAPYSDVDLMLLYAPGSDKLVNSLAKRLFTDLYDTGLDVGQSVRTTDQACSLAAEDAVVCTALMESRLLAGSMKLYRTFTERFQKQTKSRYKTVFKTISDARRSERSQYGETVYMLEPNVKRSRGGLRELQFLRWIGFTCYGTTDPEALQLLGVLSKEDQLTLREAQEYLLRLRNELHFQASKSNDVLDKTEQVRLAALYNHRGTEGILPVEQFMGEYFRHTRKVRSVVSNFSANARPDTLGNKIVGAMFSYRVEGDYRVTPREIIATPRGLAKLQTDLSEVLRLCDLANLHDKRIAPSTWEAIRQAVPNLPGDISPEVCKQFLSLISQPGRLGELLRRLHELGVLEKIIPGFTHARCLLQFNEYHKYTVDEHCILAVDRATDFVGDTGTLGRVYLGIKQKRILHLALLIHDLGKGFVEDHSEVGLRIADETVRRLRLPLREAEAVKFLVHKHLVMSHLAFRRDTSDDQLALRFAVDVGSPEMLDMLYVLTAADFAAVGPGVWNSWKSEVLAGLYRRTMQRLSGDAATVDSSERLDRRRAAVRAALVKDKDLEWYDRQIEALPHTYAFSLPPERIAAELRELHSLGPEDVRALGHFLPESNTVEYVVMAHEQITPGVFHKLTGALAGQGLEILSAEINTLADGLILDRFYVHDPDFSDPPPADRLETVSQALAESLRSPQGSAPPFRKVWKTAADKSGLSALPTRVHVDNSTSEHYTILDIFACNRPGLLYTITRKLFELDLSVSIAKIGTYLDQVVDVFYVTDRAGNKIADDHRVQQIAAGLREAIEGMGPPA